MIKKKRRKSKTSKKNKTQKVGHVNKKIWQKIIKQLIDN